MSTESANKPDNLVAKTGLFKGMNPTMGIASMVMILAFVFYTIRDVEVSSAVFASGKDFIIGSLDWFYVLVVNAALFFVLWLMVSRFGHVKLGKDDDEPDFSTFSWVCMLFSAGLGSGLIYWGVAEPMFHIQGNPFIERAGIEPGSVDAAVSGVVITNFHWGFHGCVGRQFILTVRRQLPLRGGNSLSSSIFRQQLAEKDDELSRKRGTDSDGCIVETGAFPERSGAASRGYGGHGSISSQAPIGGRIGW